MLAESLLPRPLSKMPVHYNMATGSARPSQGKKRVEKDSDDDDLAPGSSFKRKKLSLLVRAISFIHQALKHEAWL